MYSWKLDLGDLDILGGLRFLLLLMNQPPMWRNFKRNATTLWPSVATSLEPCLLFEKARHQQSPDTDANLFFGAHLSLQPTGLFPKSPRDFCSSSSEKNHTPPAASFVARFRKLQMMTIIATVLSTPSCWVFFVEVSFGVRFTLRSPGFYQWGGFIQPAVKIADLTRLTHSSPRPHTPAKGSEPGKNRRRKIFCDARRLDTNQIVSTLLLYFYAQPKQESTINSSTLACDENSSRPLAFSNRALPITGRP